MDPRFSLRQYPRVDNVYKSKSSYNFESINSKVYLKRPYNNTEEAVKRWLIHVIIGFFVGVIAFCMSCLEEWITEFHSSTTQSIITSGTNLFWAYFFWTGIALLFAFLAAILTVYIGPYAAGSGVPEVMGMLNGVNV